MTPIISTAVVQVADDTEQQLIDNAVAVARQENHCKWEIGRLAHEWTQKYANGRTDEVFAEQVGLSRVQVSQRRNVFETFSDVCNTYYKISWSHFRVALDWSDAEEWLGEANKNGWSVATMKQRRREANAVVDELPVESTGSLSNPSTSAATPEPDAGQDSTVNVPDTASGNSPQPSGSTTQQSSADDLQKITKDILAEKTKTLKVKSLHEMVELAKAFNVVLDNTAKPNIDVKRLMDIREEVTEIFQKAFRDAFGKKTEVAE